MARWNNLSNIAAEVLILEDVTEFSTPSLEIDYFGVLSAFYTSLIFLGTLQVGRLSTGQYLHTDLSIQNGAFITSWPCSHAYNLDVISV